MNKLLPIAVAIVAAGGLAATACTVNSTTNNTGGSDAGTDTGSTVADSSTGSDTSTTEDSAVNEDVGVEAAAPVTYVRFANWSPDAPSTGYDVCIAPHGTTTWTGPLISAVVGDAGPPIMFTFPTVTTYFTGIDPGTYDIEIVAGNATDCSTVVGTAGTAIPAFAANGYYTVALVGDTNKGSSSDPALTVTGFVDDGPATGGNVGLRFLNVAPSLGQVDFGTGALGASSFSPLEISVPFAGVATMTGSDSGATTDAQGYVTVTPPGSAVEFSGHLTSGSTDTATASNQMLTANSSMTLALINGQTGGKTASFLVCPGDGVQSATQLVTTCAQVSQ